MAGTGIAVVHNLDTGETTLTKPDGMFVVGGSMGSGRVFVSANRNALRGVSQRALRFAQGIRAHDQKMAIERQPGYPFPFLFEVR